VPPVHYWHECPSSGGQVEQWNKPLKYDTDLFLPLPMESLQGALQGVRHYIERKGVGGHPRRDAA